MIICGINFTHDGGVAVIDGDRLVFSIEAEKIANNARYSALAWPEVARTLLAEGLDVADVDVFAVDGWWSRNGAATSAVSIEPGVRIRTAGYFEPDGVAALDAYQSGMFPLPPFDEYESYPHVLGHILGSYCTSPQANETASVLVWDGGTVLRLYEVVATGSSVRVENRGVVMNTVGRAFAEFCLQVDPFKPQRGTDGRLSPDLLTVAGKAMAYAALGRLDQDLYRSFRATLSAGRGLTTGSDLLKCATARNDLTGADLIRSLQDAIGDELVAVLEALSSEGRLHRHLCLAGGCFLNIKWNTQIRSTELFDEVWVPPTTNDTGAALGAACAAWARRSRGPTLQWNVRSGPALRLSSVPARWTAESCPMPRLAEFLWTEGQPVVLLDEGRSEIGPRALGGRSIVAPAHGADMLARLNEIKGREWYRPVSPISPVEAAPRYFDPGSPDPYMLFEHAVRPEFKTALPAITHIDGTARLQTVDAGTWPRLHALLTAYGNLSGAPILCNTSANFTGRGFFPDVASAAQWGRVDAIWARGLLYRRRSTGTG